jgi:hypothetical protein
LLKTSIAVDDAHPSCFFSQLIYAVLVLRMGVNSVFLRDDETCSETAPELFQSSTVFVCLSIGAWSTIVLGYLVPFCFVATLLTLNGYSPAMDTNREREGTHFPGVFPAAYTNNAAPAGCIDQLRTVLLEEFPDDYPTECCVSMIGRALSHSLSMRILSLTLDRYLTFCAIDLHGRICRRGSNRHY